MIRKGKRLFGIISSCLVMSTMIGSYVPPIVGYHSLNNASSSTYKTSESLFDKIVSSLSSKLNFNEIFNYSESKDYPSNDEVLSYLIENDLVSNDLDINQDDLFANKTFMKFDYTNSKGLVKRSDFLVTLSKAVFGVESSRVLVYKDDASRVIDGKRVGLNSFKDSYIPSNFEDYLKDLEEDESLDFSSGDYLTYVTPNVYEIYFKKLIDKGIVSLDSFSNLSFMSDIKSYGSVSNGVKQLPIWSNELSNYFVNYSNTPNGVSVYGDNPLGQAFNFEDGNVSNNDKVTWLLDEDLVAIDGLKYIESVLRLSEQDMTELESTIINYKYGVDYLSRVPEEDQSTVKFLVAKGILNFEDESDFDSLYKPMTMNFFLKMIYRVHNTNARMKFNEVQLTDNENYWLEKGFSSGNVSLVNSSEYPWTSTTVSEVTSEVSEGLFKSRPVTIAAGAKSYKIERTFYNSTVYTYKGIEISKSMGTDNEDISKVEEIKKSDGSIGGVKVTFDIQASSEEAAIAILDTYTKTTVNGGADLGTVPTMNKVTQGKKTSSYISQDALYTLKDVPIKVIEDKYLINTETGARALLLEDNNVAIVGNEIIHTDSNIVFGLNGEVHYNTEILFKLLSNVMIDSLDPNSVYLTTGKNFTESIYALKSADGSSIGNTYVSSFYVKNESLSNRPSNELFYNVSQTNAFSNTLIKDISSDVGKDSPMYMVVEFKYVVSKNMTDLFSDFDITKYLNNELTMAETFNWIYNKPTSSSTLAKWWDENISFSNSLVNYMMGTTNLNYMKSGYLVPHITILSDSADSWSVDKLNKFFSDKVKVSSSLVSEYTSFSDTFFNYNGSVKEVNALDSLRSSRGLNIVTPRTVTGTDANYVDYGDYVVNKAGQIYRLIASDSTLEVSKSKKTLTRATRHYQKSGFRVGALYTLKDKDKTEYEYICDVASFSYTDVLMTSTQPVEAVYKNNTLYTKDGNVNLSVYIKNLNASFNSSTVTSSSLLNSTGNPGISYMKNNGYYYMAGEFKFKKGTTVTTMDATKSSDLDKLENSTIYVYPRLAFNQLEFTINDENIVDKEYNFPFLDMGTVTNVGITSQIIDSIVQSNSDIVSQSGIPEGASVVIGDIEFVKKSGYLVSPILEKTSISSKYAYVDLGKGTDSNDNVKALVAETLGSVGVSLTSNYRIQDTTALSNYLTYSGIGSGTGQTSFNNALVRENNKLVIKDGSRTLTYGTSNSNFSSYSISITLDSNIKFRPIGSDNSFYSLVSTVGKNSDGYISNLNFFRETLSYSDLDSFNGTLSKSLFSPSKNAEQMIQNFRDLFSLQAQEDFLGLVKYWIRMICLILVFSNILIAYLKRTPIDVLIRDIRYPTASDRNGIDIYKVLTFGFQDVDTEISLLKAVGLSFMFFFIMVIVSL